MACVRRIQNAFDDQFPTPAFPDPFQVLPTERGIELFDGPGRHGLDVLDAVGVADDVPERTPGGTQHLQAPARPGGQVEQVAQRGAGRGRQAVLDVFVTLPGQLEVQSDHQGRTTSLACAVDQPPDEIPVSHHIELEPERSAGARRNVFDGADAAGGQGEGDAEAFGGAGRQDLAVGVQHARQPRRRQGDRHGHGFAQHAGRQAALRDVDGDPLPEFQRLQIGFVGPIRGFRPGAGIHVVVEHARYSAPGQAAQVFDAGDAV